MNNLDSLTPRQIVAELDKYIVGQQDAKRNVAIALRNRWRRMNVTSEIQEDIIPNNILMIGATGVGKTEIARRLARIADAPFVKVEASKFTEVGYVGRDVESMVRDLVEQSVNMVKARKKEEVKEKAAAAVEDIILDALIPAIKSPAPKTTGFIPGGVEGSDVSSSDHELNERTRNHFREKIKNGELEERKIEIDVKQGGVAAALWGTAAGLFVAIPAVVAYNVFGRRARSIVTDMDIATRELILLLKMNKSSLARWVAGEERKKA
jgi:ATP-dependent HslUV protease ATP-binding subunit HslU